MYVLLPTNTSVHLVLAVWSGLLRSEPKRTNLDFSHTNCLVNFCRINNVYLQKTTRPSIFHTSGKVEMSKSTFPPAYLLTYQFALIALPGYKCNHTKRKNGHIAFVCASCEPKNVQLCILPKIIKPSGTRGPLHKGRNGCRAWAQDDNNCEEKYDDDDEEGDDNDEDDDNGGNLIGCGCSQ